MEGTSWILYFVIFVEITALISGGRRTRRECRDTFRSCPSWSKAGMCENNRFGFVMRGGCAKACGFCKVSEDTIQKTNLEASTQDVKSGLSAERTEKKNSDSQSSASISSKPKPRGKKLDKDSDAKLNPSTGPTVPPAPINHTTPTTATTPTTQTTVTTATTPTTSTTVTTPATPTTFTTVTTSTTPTTRTTQSTPTTHATVTTSATNPTLSTPTTATTPDVPQSDSKDKPKSSKMKDDDDTKVKNKKCKDVFTKCQEWKEQKDICKSPKFKPYMEFGCANSCSLCKSDVIPNEAAAESPQHNDALNIEIADKKTKLALWPEDEKKDVDSKLNDVVEIGIAREMIEAIKKPKQKAHLLSKTLKEAKTKSAKPSKTSRSKIPQKKRTLKKKETPSSKKSAKRVQIEDGFKTSNPYSNVKEVESTFDKMDLQNTALGSEARDLLSSDTSELKANAFDALSKDLPDFGGLDNVGDVEKILDTPSKPNKKLDYYVEHFSSDPYVAESEKEQWLKENSIRPKQYRRGSVEMNSQGSRTSKHSSQSKQIGKKHNGKHLRKPNTKRVEIEDGFKEPSTFANVDGVAHSMSKVDLQSKKFGSETGSFADKTNEVNDLLKLPDFEGLTNRKDVQEILETPSNKKFDYYVEHFSTDPYLAESEKEQWMKDNETKLKQYRRRLKGTKLTRSTKHINI